MNSGFTERRPIEKKERKKFFFCSMADSYRTEFGFEVNLNDFFRGGTEFSEKKFFGSCLIEPPIELSWVVLSAAVAAFCSKKRTRLDRCAFDRCHHCVIKDSLKSQTGIEKAEENK